MKSLTAVGLLLACVLLARVQAGCKRLDASTRYDCMEFNAFRALAKLSVPQLAHAARVPQYVSAGLQLRRLAQVAPDKQAHQEPSSTAAPDHVPLFPVSSLHIAILVVAGVVLFIAAGMQSSGAPCSCSTIMLIVPSDLQ